MIKAIMFDFGGVYIASPFAAIDDIAEEMNVSGDLLKKIIFGDYHLDGDHPWHCLERGEITLDETRNRILKEGAKHDIDADIYHLFAKFAEVERGIFGPLVDKTVEWKKRGYQLAMITNNIKEFPTWRDIFPYDTAEMYEVISDSSALSMRKPNPKIYHHTLDQLGVEPHEALFLDDYPQNIIAANELGIHGYIVDGPIEEAIAWVESKLTD